MSDPADSDETKGHFLDVKDAEVVHGPDVVAGEVSAALKDADRFGMPHVVPPLTEALSEAKRADTSDVMPGEGASAQNALAGEPAEVDEKAGSAEVLKPAGQDPA